MFPALLSLPARCRGRFRGLAIVTAGLLIAGTADIATVAVADSQPAGGEYTVEPVEGGVEIRLDDQPVARYWASHTAKPILWPLVGVNGKELTRGYPMRDAAPSERDDHVHHRSFWMTHGEVNGIDFWAEGEGRGTIKPLGEAKAEGGSTATLDARHQWVGPDGKRILTDRWQLTFDGDGQQRWIDCVFSLTASEGDVVFGDTKEGSFGVRVAGTMKVDAGKGGRILNAEGLKNKAAWGKPSPWVDYSGPVDGQPAGLTIMNHPTSYGYPVRWHVRTYGLFAANPFGVYHFTGGEPTEGKKLSAGDTWTLRFRVLLHDGQATAETLEQAWSQYSGK